jgi:hypothetical protein
MKTKICKECNKEKPASEFYISYGKYLHSRCKVCECNIRRNSTQLKQARVLSQKRRAIVLTHYGNKCACCGETHYEFLAIDHINGGGSKQKREVYGSHLYEWLIKNNFPEGYRVLCHNCNTSLGHYGYCPHERESK